MSARHEHIVVTIRPFYINDYFLSSVYFRVLVVGIGIGPCVRVCISVGDGICVAVDNCASTSFFGSLRRKRGIAFPVSDVGPIVSPFPAFLAVAFPVSMATSYAISAANSDTGAAKKD
jgi:hypothetical protein